MIITILRKPLEGTVAENALKHGCGALNIDATRVAGEPWKWGTQTDIRGGGFGSKRPSDGNVLNRDVEGGFNGRWPANFILIHKEGCELKGYKKVKSGTAYQDNKTKIKRQAYGDFNPVNMKGKAGYAGEDGKETVTDWDCEQDCPVKGLDKQSRVLKSGGRSSKYYADTNSDRAVYTWKGKNGVSKELKPSVGGASRFFKQFKKENN